MIYTLDQFSDDIRSALRCWSDPKDAALSMGPLMQRLAREGGATWRSPTAATRPGRRPAWSRAPTRGWHRDA